MRILRKYPFVLPVWGLAPLVFLSYHLYSLLGVSHPGPWSNADSDTALHVLMAYHFEPWDLYYWGQDRLGSVIPALAAIPVQGFGLDAVYATTGVIYVLLLIGWMGFALFLNNPFLAWVLGVFLLTPPWHFVSLIQAGHPGPGQVFFLGLMAAALTRWPAPWVPPALVVLAGGSLWASDFSIVILAVVVAIWLLEKRDLSAFLRLSSVVAGAGTILFLVAAKHTAPSNRNLFSFSSLDGFLANLQQYGKSLTEFFFSPPYALLLLSGGIAVTRLAVLPASFSKRCSQVGLLCVVASFLVVAGSRWVELSKGHIRYLDIVFFCFVLTLLLAVSAELNRKWKIVQYALLVGSVALHLASLMPYVQSSPSARDTLRPLLTSSCTAFIGDYWTTYLVAGMFPHRFLATPHEGSYVRSARMRDAVLAQKEICLIKKEGWSNGFFHRRVEPATAGTSTVSDAPAGFEPYGGARGTLTFTPGRTYRARVDNGQPSEERWFTTATCQQSGAPAITSIVSRCEAMVPQATIHFSGPPDDRGGFFVHIDPEAIDPKTEWLEKFPEEITQFGVALKKIDSPQRYGKFSICRYAQ